TGGSPACSGRTGSRNRRTTASGAPCSMSPTGTSTARCSQEPTPQARSRPCSARRRPPCGNSATVRRACGRRVTRSPARLREQNEREHMSAPKALLAFLVGRPLIAVAIAAVVVGVLVLVQTQRQKTPVTHRVQHVALTDQQQRQLGAEEYAKELRANRA